MTDTPDELRSLSQRFEEWSARYEHWIPWGFFAAGLLGVFTVLLDADGGLHAFALNADGTVTSEALTAFTALANLVLGFLWGRRFWKKQAPPATETKRERPRRVAD